MGSDAGVLAHTAGKLAEQAVDREFGLQEPRVEVKACRSQWQFSLVRCSQLHSVGACDKPYVFVIYSRPRTKIPGSKTDRRGSDISLAAAFCNELQFLFVTAQDLLDFVEADSAVVKKCTAAVSNSNYKIHLKRLQAYMEKRYPFTRKVTARWTSIGNIPEGEVPF